jgi:hypothetical protein
MPLYILCAEKVHQTKLQRLGCDVESQAERLSIGSGMEVELALVGLGSQGQR